MRKVSCHRCGATLRTAKAQQCLECGHDWHEPGRDLDIRPELDRSRRRDRIFGLLAMLLVLAIPIAGAVAVWQELPNEFTFLVLGLWFYGWVLTALLTGRSFSRTGSGHYMIRRETDAAGYWTTVIVSLLLGSGGIAVFFWLRG